METSIIRDAIDRIVKLAAPTIAPVGDRIMSNQPLFDVTPKQETPGSYGVNTLQGLVTMLKAEGPDLPCRLMVSVDGPQKVTVCSDYWHWDDKNPYARVPLYAAMPDVPTATFGHTMSHDRAIVELRSLYMPSYDLEYLLDLLSTIDTNEQISSEDNGVTQVATVRSGVQLKATQTIKPIVTLQPYRTFLEVEQPVSDFLLRVDKEGGIALHQADGGAWKLAAKRSIAAYLKEQLAEEINAGKVVVTI